MKARKFSKAIGIIGGAGPAASAFLYSTLIELCQKQYGSNDYHEFPEIILESFPFIRGDDEGIRRDLSLCLSKLKNAGADLFCLASHSLHGCLPNVSAIPFVHLISESLREVSSRKLSKILILAAQKTIGLKLYEREKLTCFYPPEKEQQQIQTWIRQVASGKVTREQSMGISEMVNRLQREWPFEAVLIACTELPLIHRQFPLALTVPVIDTSEVLARRLLSLAE